MNSLKVCEGGRKAQLRHTFKLPPRKCLEAAEGLADVLRRFEEMRAKGKLR